MELIINYGGKFSSQTKLLIAQKELSIGNNNFIINIGHEEHAHFSFAIRRLYEKKYYDFFLYNYECRVERIANSLDSFMFILFKDIVNKEGKLITYIYKIELLYFVFVGNNALDISQQGYLQCQNIQEFDRIINILNCIKKSSSSSNAELINYGISILKST